MQFFKLWIYLLKLDFCCFFFSILGLEPRASALYHLNHAPNLSHASSEIKFSLNYFGAIQYYNLWPKTSLCDQICGYKISEKLYCCFWCFYCYNFLCYLCLLGMFSCHSAFSQGLLESWLSTSGLAFHSIEDIWKLPDVQSVYSGGSAH